MGVGTQKRQLAGLRQLSLFHGQQPLEAATRGERIYGDIMASLGRPGTYGGPAGVAMPGGVIRGAEDRPTYETLTAEKGYAGLKGRGLPPSLKPFAEVSQVDPEAMAAQIKSGAQFRIASQMTAEAEQLLQRKGPLYEQYQRSMQAPLMQRASRQMEDTMAQLDKDFARGGSARRSAMKSAMQIQAQLQTNEALGENLMQANVQLDAFARQRATDQLNFNMAWAANQAGVRQSYMDNFQRAADMMVSQAIPRATEITNTLLEMEQAEKSATLNKILGGVMMGVGVVGSLFGGAGAGLVGAGASMMGGGAPTGGMMGALGGAAGAAMPTLGRLAGDVGARIEDYAAGPRFAGAGLPGGVSLGGPVR